MLTLGIMVGTQIMRFVPAPPVFSERLGRITNLQSYENNYFASLRSFTQRIEASIASGRRPIIVLGDSTFRGTGAIGRDVWTAKLGHRLAELTPNFEVLNFSQNAGDLLGPYMFYYFYNKYPTAYFIMQWNSSNRVMIRHQFHYWLSDEIILRDWRSNPAVSMGLEQFPVKSDELFSMVMAGANILFPYRDLGNYIRFFMLGTPYITPARQPIILPLDQAEERDSEPEGGFVPRPDPGFNQTMRDIYKGQTENLTSFVSNPGQQFYETIDRFFRADYRERLLVVTIALNPYFASEHAGDSNSLETHMRSWKRFRELMSAEKGLHWISLRAGDGELTKDDFVDLGHLSAAGQDLLAKTVSTAFIEQVLHADTH